MTSPYRRKRVGPFMAYIWNSPAGTIRDSHGNQVVREGSETAGKNEDETMPGRANNRNSVNLTQNSINLLVRGRYRLITPDGHMQEFSETFYPTVRRVQDGFYTFVYLEDTEYLCLIPWTREPGYWARTNHYVNAGAEILIEPAAQVQYLFVGAGQVRTDLAPIWDSDYHVYRIEPNSSARFIAETRVCSVEVREP